LAMDTAIALATPEGVALPANSRLSSIRNTMKRLPARLPKKDLRGARGASGCHH